MRYFLQSQIARAKLKQIYAPVIIVLALAVVFLTSCVQKAVPATTSNKSSQLADEVVFTEEPDSAKATSELEAGTMQLYAGGLTDP
jgi:hypothetical protein